VYNQSTFSLATHIVAIVGAPEVFQTGEKSLFATELQRVEYTNPRRIDPISITSNSGQSPKTIMSEPNR
jgi:hypothetical protein